LLSSHILTELAELCDSAAIMERGQLVVSGALDDIRAQAAHRRLRIQAVGDLATAVGLVEGFRGVKQVLPVENTENGNGHTSILEVEFTGDAEAAADLLETLVRQGVRVASFAEVATDLEQAFLRLTKGEVA
jgi:ABC-2 type transport system ATP-binding protein